MKAFFVSLAILLIGGTIVFMGCRILFGNPADKAFAQDIAGKLAEANSAQARAVEALSNAQAELVRLNAQLTQAQLDNQRADLALKYAAIVGVIVLVLIAIVAAYIAWDTHRTWKAKQAAQAGQPRAEVQP